MESARSSMQSMSPPLKENEGGGGYMYNPPQEPYSPHHQQQQPLHINAGSPMAPEPPRDATRAAMCMPGSLVYSAKMDRDSLKCFYRMRFHCCSESVVSRTFFDVYSHGIHVNVPTATCCCLSSDNGTVVFYDDDLFGGVPHRATCCSPIPYLCPNTCDCFGEALALNSRCCCCFGFPKGLGHWWGACGSYYACGGCCAVDVFQGLAPGEAEKLAAELNQAIEAARNGSRVVALPPKPYSPMQ